MRTVSFLVAATLLSACALSAQSDWDVNKPGLKTRQLRFTCSEGTWMNVDVHPKSGEILFDLLGDIYRIPGDGGKAQLIKGGMAWDMQPRWSPDGSQILFTSDAGGGDNLWVISADGEDARAITKESYRLLNNGNWHPSGQYVVGRKHFTSRRSLGAGEMWLYPLSGGPGEGLTIKRNDQMDSGEPVFSPDGLTLYWSEDVSPGRVFEYNKDPNGEIYAIFKKDLLTGEVERFISGPGGAVRPQPSPDGQSVAFVRRVRTKSVLFLKDIATGHTRRIYDGLTRDQQETWAIHGVHPGYGWTGDSQHIITQAKGKLVRIEVETGNAVEIPFSVDVDLEIAKTRRHQQPVFEQSLKTRVCRWPTVSPDGSEVLFGALGRIWRKSMDDGAARPVTGEEHFSHTPAWAPDGSAFVYTTWDDELGGSVRILSNRDFRIRGDRDRTLISEPGHYLYPDWSPNGRWIVYQKLGGDNLRGTRNTNDTGIYLISAKGGEPLKILDRGRRPRFNDRSDRVLFEGQEDGNPALISIDLSGNDRLVIATSKQATEFAFSRDLKWLAFTELWNAYLCPFPPIGRPLHVSPDLKSVPVVRLTNDAGEDLSFSPDGSIIYHALAHKLRGRSIKDLFDAPFGSREVHEDSDNTEEKKKTPNYEDGAIVVDLGVPFEADNPEGDLLLKGGTLITMKDDEVIKDGALWLNGNRIKKVGTAADIDAWDVPSDARVLDLNGQVILPGLLDVHAHISHGTSQMLPEQNWQHLANLSFGVTTTHDPSSDTRRTFAAAEMQRSGRIIAPRIFSTGTILYGAEGGFKAVINNLDDARSHIRRTMAYGPTTVKSYNQPRRDQRQQVLVAADELGIMVVPEGGSTLQHNLSHLVDGHTTLEHALPVAPIYDDVLTLFAECGTAYTPTLIVGYGGIWGENYWYHKTDVWKNERLMTWMPRHLLDARARRRTMAPDEEYNHIELAKGAAQVAARGGLVEVGAHGQIQGLGVHWEMWMFSQGGMPHHDVLRTATIWPATAFGMESELGTLEEGKLADVIVIDGNPLENIRDTQNVEWVILNGRAYNARTLDQIHPEEQPLAKGPDLTPASDAANSIAPTCPCGEHH